MCPVCPVCVPAPPGVFLPVPGTRYETTFLAISRTKIMRQVVCLSGRRPVPLCSGAEQKGLYKSGNAQIVPWSKVNKLRNKSGTG